MPPSTISRPSVFRSGVQLSTPVTNHNNREMRTNCNPPPQIQSLMLALIRRLLVGPYYCLILQSGAWWGRHGRWGRVNLEEKEERGGAVSVNCSKTDIPPQTLGAEAALAHTARAPQSQKSLGEICPPSSQASRQGSAADSRPPAGRTRPWAGW